jgi:hypothetical protein
VANPGGSGRSSTHVLKERPLFREVLAWIWHRKLFWLLPLVLAILLVGALIAGSETSALTPFIYPLF